MLEMLLKLPGVEQVTRTVSPLWRSVTGRVRASPRHASCPHAYGCLHYVLKVRFDKVFVLCCLHYVLKVRSDKVFVLSALRAHGEV